LYEGTLENRKHWKDLAEKVEMGLTWIDHDKIEIPVEEFFSKLFNIFYVTVLIDLYICSSQKHERHRIHSNYIEYYTKFHEEKQYKS